MFGSGNLSHNRMRVLRHLGKRLIGPDRLWIVSVAHCTGMPQKLLPDLMITLVPPSSISLRKSTEQRRSDASGAKAIADLSCKASARACNQFPDDFAKPPQSKTGDIACHRKAGFFLEQ